MRFPRGDYISVARYRSPPTRPSSLLRVSGPSSIILMAPANLTCQCPSVLMAAVTNVTCPTPVVIGPAGPPPPQFRTLANILWSCLLTIFACTWTSIHPNIWPCAKPWDRFRYRIALFILNVLMPETMVQWSISQWFAARKLAQDYNGMAFPTSDVLQSPSFLQGMAGQRPMDFLP